MPYQSAVTYSLIAQVTEDQAQWLDALADAYIVLFWLVCILVGTLVFWHGSLDHLWVLISSA